MSENMNLRPALRLMPVTRSALDTGARTIRVSFSSETPVDQWFGREVLSHAPGAADLSRLNDGGPVLWNHDRGDIRGVVEHAEIGPDRRGYAVVRFARTAAGEEAMGLVRDGIVRGISVSYQIGQMSEERDAEGALYRILRWTPLEISLAPVPADATVGVGRAALPPPRRHLAVERPVDVIRAASSPLAAPSVMARSAPQPAGASMSVTRLPSRAAAIDLSARDRAKYSIIRAITQLTTNARRPQSGLEFEVSREIERATGYEGGGRSILIPLNLMATRAVTAIATSGNATGGGALVGTELDDAGFIENLYPVSRVMQLGARTLPNLLENVDLPRAKIGATAEWITEGDPAGETESVFDKVVLKPRMLSAYSQITQTLVRSITPQAEDLIRGDIAQAIGSALDAAAVAGTGIAPVPTGILSTSGIGTVSIGTNGGAVTVAAMDDLEAAVTDANVDGPTMGYLTTPQQVRKLRGLVDSAGRPIWQTYADPDAKPGPGHWNGRVVVGSNNVPKNLTKGTGTNLSAIIFGRWSDVVIADWGFLELRPNPYGIGFMSGTVELNSMLFADIGIRHPQAFAAITDAT